MRTSISIALLLLALVLASCADDAIISQSKAAVTNNRPSVLGNDDEVRIGTQVWAAKNLNVSHYRNGDIIPQVQYGNGIEWQNLTTGAWCYFQINNSVMVDGRTYGKLYNWYAVNDPRGLAPQGWHIPTNAEWITLIDFLGGNGVAGGKMKAISTLWNTPNTGATNSSGFTGIPTGFCQYFSGQFLNYRTSSDWWSATAFDANTAWRCNVFYFSSAVSRGSIEKNYGFSVRCIKD